MAKDKEQEARYKAEGKRRSDLRKKERLRRWIEDSRYRPGSGMYERRVENGEIQTCEWGNSRCDLYGCNGDC